MVEKRFLIPVDRRWKLLILPILALLYFVAVVLLAALGFEVEGVPMEYLVLAGAALFALVFLIELPFLIRRKVRKPEGSRAEEDAFAPVEGASSSSDADVFAPPVANVQSEYAAPEPVAAAPVVEVDDEVRMTQESAKGFRVVEYSRPAKSMRPGAVYAKTMVPVSKEHVLRVETLAADRHEV